MPTGVAIREVRRQLFDAAERILLAAGPNALTSRAVTTEAGCAKGVLHRHFADFDTFLAELVLDRIDRMDPQAAALRAAAGTGTVTGNLVTALPALFESAAVAMVGLVTARDGVRARLRESVPAGVPVLTDGATMVAGYLAAERERGRIAAATDTDMLAYLLIGTAHLLYADKESGPPDQDTIRRMVTSALDGALP